ncbi:MAG: divergent polysaccharide deacetylase family protein [Gammaproteobacteria bacterium]
MLRYRFKNLIIFVFGLLTAAPLHCLAAEPAVIAIIIDDIGNNLSIGKRVIDSDLAITCSILPARPHSIKLARLAHKNGKEVMLHLPMQASKSERLGHGGLMSNMSKQEFIRVVDISIDAIPHAKGINNHMGSLLTSNPNHMEWLMQTIANRDENLFFVDSKTSARTVAADAAQNYHIPNMRRDIFLDSTANDKNFVRQQLRRLIKLAKLQGYALAIGHPHSSTLTVLEQELSKLSNEDVQLVTVSKLINIAKDKQWKMYSSLTY